MLDTVSQGSGRAKPEPSTLLWLKPGSSFREAKAILSQAKAGASEPSQAGTALDHDHDV
jgi:hypothetical protein